MKRLLVNVAAVTCMAFLAACRGGSTAQVDAADPAAAPVEMEASAPAGASLTSPEPYNELLDPEFGCHGGGHLEYGLVDPG